jgi:ABC-type multidrug transport system permease subunit
VVLQESQPEPELTVEECMALYAGYYPRSRSVQATLALVGLADRLSARCGQLSGGQRRRLDVGLALIGDPELLFLDEPTTGFDPAARRAAWEMIAGLRDLGKTIFLTTHYMEEAERLADRIAVIAKGHIVAEGTATDIGLHGQLQLAARHVSQRSAPDGGRRSHRLPGRQGGGENQQPAVAGRRSGRLGEAARRRSPRLGGGPAHTRGRLSGVDRGATMTAARPGAKPARSSVVRLGLHQYRADLRCFYRNKQAVFFTLALPVVFLVIFGSVFQHQNVAVAGGRIDEPVYYVPGIIAYGVIAATFSNLVVSIVRYREAGIYKRRRTTPALAITAVLLAVGWAAFAAHIPARTGPAFLLDILLGAVVFCCLGFAAASLIKDADAAQPVVLGILLPLCFISGVFIPILELPHWLIDIGKVFPVHALADSLLADYNPHTTGSGLNWVDLAVLVAWGTAGLVVALRRFSWLPQTA